MAYADYEFYKDTYLGDAISEDDFPRLAARASDYVYAYTKGLADQVKGKAMEMVKKATCAVAEAIQDELHMTTAAFAVGKGGNEVVSSETVGGHSVSYKTASVSSAEVEYLDKKKREALELYLGNLPEFAGLFRVKSYRCLHDARCGR